MQCSYILCFIAIAHLFGCKNKTSETFYLLSPNKSNVYFNNELKDTIGQNILDYLYYYNGGGVAIGDINNDGLPDIYFTANQTSNKLYLNKGNLQFQDITEQAKVKGNNTWSTGVSMADVNGDGLLDIYVCAVVGTNGFTGKNELYINNGDLTFTEQAQLYGLDFDNYSSSATFFDYDLDGDLDVYLLNHAIHTQESFGKSTIRNNRTYESGDKLLRNDNNKFIDVSAEAGIFGGANGYGLGVAISDFNLDGYPDIYVSNDFHEDDYYYINNGNGTFTETLKTHFGHISKFSMGSDTGDINNDGYFDLITLDMLPYDEAVLKSSAGNDNFQLQKFRTEYLGYHYQYSRNMLQINQEAKCFTETALLSGVSATDWSWSALIADYNQDSKQDIFITNGIPKRPNDLDYIKYISNEQVKKKLETTNLIDDEALNNMPNGKLRNVFFQGLGDLKFENKTLNWVSQDKTYTTGAAYGDLDNDGDLDLVTNNINANANLYINKTNTSKNYLKLKFNYLKNNKFGIGTKAIIYHNDKKQVKELFLQRGFQSSSQPILHFGLDTIKKVDSVKVIWPNKTYQILKNVKTNQSILITPKQATPYFYKNENTKTDYVFKPIANKLGINYKHTDNNYIDSNRHKLIPYQISDRGTALAIGDLNKDGRDDVFFGNGKHIPSEIYLQNNYGFEKLEDSILKKNAIIESNSALILDFNNDKQADLFVSSGGGEFYGKRKPLQNNLYTLTKKGLNLLNIPKGYEDTAVVKANDFDNDGDLDVFVGNATISNNFGDIPESYILQNNNGNFVKKSLGKLGMVRDAIWTDFNSDSKPDIIVVGEWMSPVFLENNNGNFINNSKDYTSKPLNGLWRAIAPFDIDKDGNLDYLLGNWGLNSKFKASQEYPMLMYYADFDKNSKTETVLAIEKNEKYYTIEGLDDLSSQLLYLTKKKFTSYKKFAGKPIEEVFGNSILKKSKKLEVHTLASGYLKNINGKFVFKKFKNNLQVAPINCFKNIVIDKEERMLCAGNYFGVKPFHGRFDGFLGAVINNENNIKLAKNLGLDFFDKSVTKIETITFNNNQYLICVIHNEDVQIYKIN